MKRFASIDFLRGTAILIMLVLHIVANLLDVNALLSQVNDIPLINIVLIIILPFIGGLAGFFLMVSAIGNMISMYKYLEKGKPIRELVIRQVMGGVLLLFFAMLTEGLTGYWGAFGGLLHSLNDPNWAGLLNTMLTRWNHFETIHTIAWCIIVNGVVQGILSRKDGWKDTKGMIRKYAILVLIIVVFTEPVWRFLYTNISGYPFSTNTISGQPIYSPTIGVDPWYAVILAPLLAPLAAPMEPLFPYLAVSFVGSIIGIVICQPVEKIPRNFMKKGLFIGLAMFLIGLVGIVVNIIGVMDAKGFEFATMVYEQISYHRNWFFDHPEYGQYMIPLAWLWQFFGLNGFGIMFVLIVIYLVEFRGKGKIFAEKSVVIRRFGYVAFTNYNNQWILWLYSGLIGALFLERPYVGLNWGWLFVVLVLILVTYEVINRLWEKVGYIGSLEWAIGTLGYYLIPTKRGEINAPDGQKLKWYEHGKLDVKNGFYNAEWMNVVVADEEYHKNLRDSKILEKISKMILVIPLFIPFGLFILPLAKEAKKLEGENPHVKRALLLSTISSVITVVFLLFCSIFTPNMIGFQL